MRAPSLRPPGEDTRAASRGQSATVMTASIQQPLPPMEVQRVQDTSKPVQESSRTVLKSLQEWRGLVLRAMGRCQLSQKQMAAELGVSAALLSGQLAGREGEHLSFWRMHALPPAFWQELIPLIVEYHGLTLGDSPQQRNYAAIGQLVSEAVLRVAR